MKYNKYDSNGVLKEKKWRAGANVGRVRSFTAYPRPDKNDVLYIVKLENINGLELGLSYIVPNDKTPHQLLKDLAELSKSIPSPWLEIGLRETNGLPSIIYLDVMKEPKEVIDKMATELQRKI